MVTKLNLGCGSTDWRESTEDCNWINIDKSKTVDCDLHIDIRGGLPFDDNSIESIHAGCILEQFTQEAFLFVVNECHRVLREGGNLEGYVPSTDPRVLHLDPMDKLFFHEESFGYLVGSNELWQRYGKNYEFLPWSSYTASTNLGGIIHFNLVK